MHREYPVLKKPKDENAKIWRYMGFTKFVSLIDRNALFFARIDQLDDNFEGSIPKETYQSLPFVKKYRGTDPKSIQLYMAERKLKEYDTKMRKESSRRNKAQRKKVFVNSWHLNEFESAAMWKLYLKSDEGIAIQSTYRRLSDCFASDMKVHVGMVRYVNYNAQYPFNVAGFPYICKRKSFEHEKELRAIVIKQQSDFIPNGTSNVKVSGAKIPDGLEVPVSLDRLVEKVYVSPTAEKWFEELVGSVMGKYSFNKPFTKSSLADDPIF